MTEIREGLDFHTKATRRQPGEDLYLSTTVFGDPSVTSDVGVVLYSKATLLENEGNLTAPDNDWEIVALIKLNEPMHPLTMARNFLEKSGGTKSVYTAEEFAQAIYFWSNKVRVEEVQ